MEDMEEKNQVKQTTSSARMPIAETNGTHSRHDDDDDAVTTRHAPAGPVVHVEMPSGGLMHNTWVIAQREFRAYFDSLVAYVVIGGSMVGLGVYFFLMPGFWDVGRATMIRMFEFMPWALSALVVPLITMRALAEEKRSGTIELLITLPVRDSEVILGKYFAAMGLAGVLLLCTLMYPVAMFVWPWHMGALDWGPVWAGYIGLVLYLAATIGVGLLFSSITESQIIAFFVTALVLLGAHIIGSVSVVEGMPGLAGDVVSFISTQTRFMPFARGLVDSRAIVYFLSVAVLCLLWAFRSLESRKWK